MLLKNLSDSNRLCVGGLQIMPHASKLQQSDILGRTNPVLFFEDAS